MKRILASLFLISLTLLACGGQGSSTPFPTPSRTIFESERTAYGFFPSPPEATLDSVFKLYRDLGEHADFVLIQQNAPWSDFVDGVDGESQTRTDLINQVTLARQNHLETVFVVDALNGLNRRDFIGLPAGWEASFANPKVRTAYTHYALWVVRQFHPRYLGLASEINTYMDAHPDDSQNFVSLYHEIYAQVQAEAGDTRVFVTFQWEDLNNLFGQDEPGHAPGKINWDQVEAFEPDLDLWVISSYPFAVFKSGADIPADYYAPLLTHTAKPLAVAEGGYTSQPAGPFPGVPQDQVGYLNALHNQIGSRLAFWVYLLLNDFNLDSYARIMRQKGQSGDDILTLGMFASVGLRTFGGAPKPALELWDAFRSNR